MEEHHQGPSRVRTLTFLGLTAWIAACSGGGNNDSAPAPTAVDSQAPRHGGLEVEPNFDGAVDISWETDEPSSFVLAYGVDVLDQSVSNDEFLLSHRVSLSNLVPDRIYEFQITSQDPSGNESLTMRRSFPSGPPLQGGVRYAGPARPWYPLTLTFNGPFATELDTNPNPFLDYRMLLEMVGPSGQTYYVSGYFAGDGVGGHSGSKWQVKFSPDEPGEWNYTARLVQGPEVAISLDPNEGTPVSFDGQTGKVTIAGYDPSAPGFYAHGALEYVGGHYLKFRDGPYFLKGGTDSPENLLAYAGFDNTYDQGGIPTNGLVNGLHRYEKHIGDWGAGGLGSELDPMFYSEDTGRGARGIIGALNYLSAHHVNSVYFLPMNLGGDGYDTCPFVGYNNNHFDKTHYDISKLRQWDKVFEHAMRRGILLHVVLGETEDANERWLDNGYLGVERKLFYREMIARFGHHLAIKWNISEETSFATHLVQDMAEYIRFLDPYEHPVAFHTYPLPPSGHNQAWSDVMGDTRFSMNSIQGAADHAGANVEYWRSNSANSGHPWVIDYDETELPLQDDNADLMRKKVLYDVLFSGGNIEWFAGYFNLPLGGDLRMEDFSQREEMWRYTWFARRFMQENLPFWEMHPADWLVQGETSREGGAEVFRKPGQVYAIFYPDIDGTGTIDLRNTSGTFTKRWYDPKEGRFYGPATQVQGGSIVNAGHPGTGGLNKDWVLLLKK